MNQLPLQLRRASSPQRPPAAWLLSGSEPARWLSEISRWGLDESELRLHLVPTSSTDLQPSGLFVILPRGAKPIASPAGIPYGVIASSVYLPTDAIVLPAVTDGELAKLNRYAMLVLHPTLGSIGFETGDAFNVADLLTPLPRRPEKWDAARPGIPPVPKLLSISIRLPASIEEMFGEASRDIGSTPLSLDEQPTGKDSLRPLSNAWEGVQGAILYGMSRAFSAIPHTALKRNLFNQMEDWINSKLQGQQDDLRERREQVLRELMKNLEKSPDEALKHALPLDQLGLRRGQAPPSAQLGTNTPDFSLKSLGGGQPVDGWDLSPQIQAQLRAQYQKLIERERLLGRYRRAAYIYAKLLGNLSGAALMLREGKFYQEAAILYRDHLKQPLPAAECFAEGGLHEEAVTIYRAQKAWEKLSALYRKLGDDAKARAAFASWVEDLKSADDYLKAAELVRTELGDRDAALALLVSAWPHRRQALLCAQRYLEWRSQAGEHEKVRHYLQETRPAGENLLWLDLLVHAKSTYPDREIQNLAEDMGRLEIARHFQAGKPPEQQRKFVSLLVRLAPEDHLLRRDAHRHLDQVLARVAKTTGSRPPPAPAKEVPVELLREFRLPHIRLKWLEATATDEGFFALAECERDMAPVAGLLVRSNFEGTLQDANLRALQPIPLPMPNLAFWANRHQTGQVFLSVLSPIAASIKSMAAIDGFPMPVRFWESPLPPDHVLASAFSPAGTLWLFHLAGRSPHLSSFQSEGTRLNNFALEIELPLYNYQPSLRVMDHHVALSLNQELHLFEIARGFEQSTVQSFEDPILEIIPCPRWTKPHVAVVMAHQVALTWLTGNQAHSYVVDTGLDHPKVAFTSDGLLVVVTADGGFLYDCDSKGVKFRNRFSLVGEMPVSVMTGPEVRSFATLDAGGRVQIHRAARALFRS